VGGEAHALSCRRHRCHQQSCDLVHVTAGWPWSRLRGQRQRLTHHESPAAAQAPPSPLQLWHQQQQLLLHQQLQQEPYLQQQQLLLVRPALLCRSLHVASDGRRAMLGLADLARMHCSASASSRSSADTGSTAGWSAAAPSLWR